MAQMIPPDLRHSRKRAAEKRFFELARNGLGAEWTVLHSLELARAKGKKWAEIDFVLIGPEGIFCIEVKGGTVLREKGVWHSIDREGRDYIIKDPFAQAREAYAEIERRVQSQVSLPRRALFGYGVAFPACLFREQFLDGGWPPDIPESITIDAAMTAQGIVEWISRLERFARETPGAQRSERLTKESCDLVVDDLRPDFFAPEALGPYFHEIDRDLGEAARLQFRAASGAIRDADRATILGGPGTGKSVLALEEAAFQGGLARDGLPVVLTCYNFGLAQFLREKVAARAPAVRVQTLHDLMRDVVASSGLEGRLPDENLLTKDESRNYFAEELPALAIEALELTENPSMATRAHALIVDEGQDLLREPFVRFIDAFLSGGISEGRWKLFLDPQQDAYKAFSPQGYQRFDSAKNTAYTLQFNCRNASALAGAVTILAGDGICPTESLVPGGSVAWRHFGWEDPRQQGDYLAHEVEDLLSRGVALEQIVLLSPYRFERSRAVQGYSGRFPLVDIGETPPDPQTLSFSTIYKFKGLEADAVILLDVTAGLRKRNPAILRIGASRARAHLTVMLEDNLRSAIDECVAEHETDCPNHPA